MDNVTHTYSPYITLKNGRRLWAKQYGLRAFRIPVRTPEPGQDDPDTKSQE